MVRFYKRPSDTTPFLVLYWTTLIAAALGLIFYAKDRIQTVLQRKTAVQTSRILATPENPYIPLPDVIVCGRNLTINTDEYSTEYYTLDEISLDPDNQIPCGTLFFELPGVRVDMFIFRSKNGTVHMNPEFLYFDFPNFGNGSSMFYILHPQTSVFNKYRQTNETPTPSQLMDDVHLMKSASVKDTQYVRRDIHLVQVEFSTTETHTLEDSFWGYFGRRSKNVVYSMNMDFSSVMGRSDTQETTFHLIPQPWRIVEEDTLILSVQTAVGSFGGVLSLVSSILILLFGASRLDPFGLVQNCIMSSSTKARMKNAYGTWERVDSNPGYTKEKHDAARSGQLSLEQELEAHHKQIQVHEKQFKELETLLRTYFIEMSLVETKNDDEPDVGSIV